MYTTQTEAINIKIGDRDCRHPTLIMEYAYGGPTGNYICTLCERLLPANLDRIKALNNFWVNIPYLN
jgi:hypothetical protein